MDAREQLAFDLGWDYAIFGREVPETANKAFCDGYRAFRQGDKRSTRPADRYERKWLQIRFGAFSRNKEFAPDVTPDYLRRITPESGRCPVTLLPLTFAEGEPTDWSIDRANNLRGYIRGNLIVISTAANAAKSDKTLAEIEGAAALDSEFDGLLPEEWARMAELVAPAFGPHEDDFSPVPILVGQNVALGMPTSPIASFQIAIARALIECWHDDKYDPMMHFAAQMCDLLCRTRSQKKAYLSLIKAVFRRTGHIQDYTEVWATRRVQRRLFDFINTLGAAGLTRLARLQEQTTGIENTRFE